MFPRSVIDFLSKKCYNRWLQNLKPFYPLSGAVCNNPPAFRSRDKSHLYNSPKLIKEITVATTGFKLEAIWETVQTTIIPWLIGRFMGRKTPSSPPTGEGGKAEEPLKQQVTSAFLPTRDDEAILMAIDAAVGARVIKNIQAVRATLATHQITDWRKNIGNIRLTERFEVIMTSKATTRGGNRGQASQAGANQPRGQDRIEKRWERFPIDYEWKAQDPRVRHLKLVSKIVEDAVDRDTGIATAKAYLLTGGFIQAQSSQEKAAAAAEQGTAAVTNAIHRHVGGVRSNDPNLVRLEDVIKAAGDAVAKSAAEANLRTYLAQCSRAANVARAEKAQVTKWRFRIFLAVLLVVTFTIATIYK